MEEDGLVVLTETLSDYALAAAARRELAGRESVPACYPLFAPHGLPDEQDPFLRQHGVSAKCFSDLVGYADLIARSPMPVDAPTEILLQALLQCFAADRALIVDGQASSPSPSPLALETGDSQKVVVARTGSAMALPAALYAEATGRSFVGLADMAALEERLEALCPQSVILADDLDRFPKRFLVRLLDWSQQGPLAPVLVGILTGQSVAQLSALVCRLLVHGDFRRRGGRLFEPLTSEPIAVSDMQPMEFYVATAHGNEMHLRHNQNEVLCGAFARRPETVQSFDCEPRCPHGERVRSSAVPAHAVFLLSCDAFTLADGLVPPTFNVLMNFLNGWASTVLAPFKHVQGNVGLRVLTNALIHSGYSIGEVAQRLNSVARFDDAADGAYLVLGDPDMMAKPGEARPAIPVAWERSGDGLDIACDARGAHAVEIVVLGQEIAALLDDEAPLLALEPLSETLQRPDIFFAFRWLERREALGILLFANRALPAGPLCFRLKATRGLDEQERLSALGQVKRLTALTILDFAAAAVREAESQILSILRAAAAYPRAVELVQGHAILRGVAPILESEFRSARQGILRRFLEEMGEKRIWISQLYAMSYPLVRQVAPAEPGTCRYCGNGLTVWSYEDGCTALPARRVIICDRCGIIEDCPAVAELELKLATCQSLTATAHRQGFSIVNRSARAVEVSLLHQFNQWRRLGIEAETEIDDFMLEAGEEIEGSVTFRFPPDLPDDTQHMHFFALTDRFGLHFAGQKVKSTVRADDASESIDASGRSIHAD